MNPNYRIIAQHYAAEGIAMFENGATLRVDPDKVIVRRILTETNEIELTVRVDQPTDESRRTKRR